MENVPVSAHDSSGLSRDDREQIAAHLDHNALLIGFSMTVHPAGYFRDDLDCPCPLCYDVMLTQSTLY
jgi:hypothetical protein